MLQHNSFVFLHYSSLLGIPILSDILYIAQLLLFKKTKRIYLSKRDTFLRKKILESIQKNDTVILKSYKLGYQLKTISNLKIIYDESLNLHSLSKKSILDLKWSLILSESITKKSYNSIREISPATIKISEIVFVPLHVNPTEYCDFVIKTVESLRAKNHIVSVIIFKQKKLFFFNIALLFTQLMNRPENIYPIILLPEFLEKYYRIQKINNAFSSWYISLIIERSKEALLWGFDFENFELFKRIKSRKIYDCVDYHTSTDTKIALEIESKETKVIELSDYFFTNSEILKSVRKKIKESKVVVQGFDYLGFSKNSSLSLKEKTEIEKIKQKIENYQHSVVLGFVGNLNYRINYKLLFKLLKKRKDYIFVLTKAMQHTITEDTHWQTFDNIEKLAKLENVFFIEPSKNRTYIKNIIELFDIATIPYETKIIFNKYCYPMKLFEYFFMGKKVIATNIVELKRFSEYVTIAESTREWESAIENYKPYSQQTVKKLKMIAYHNRWDIKVQQILKEVQLDYFKKIT